MGIRYTEVMENGLISDEVLALIPEVCPECGSEIEFTESLKQIYCGNSRCKAKIAARLEYMAKKMGVDGWGESTCLNVVKRFGLISPYQVFIIPNNKSCDGVSSFNSKLRDMLNSEKRKAQLWEVVMYGGIPSIETTAYKIFNGYTSIAEVYEDIERYQVSFIADKLGLKNSDGGVLACRIYNILMEYKEELEFAETCFEIESITGDIYEIAITGGVDGYKSKGDFIDYINNKFKGKAHFNLMNTVTTRTKYLIVDGGTSSSKYRKAEKLNTEGKAEIGIVSSSELLSELERAYMK